MKMMDRVVLCLGEVGGTAVLLYVGCMACAQGVSGGSIPVEQMSFAFGLAVMISIQIFGHISGCHINPIVSVTAWILGNISLVQVPIYFVGQMVGALAGFGLLVLSTPQEFLRVYTKDKNGTIIRSIGVCSPTFHSDITVFQAFLVEFLASVILSWLCCGLWDHRNSDKQDGTPVKFGLTVAALSMAAGPYTTTQINPARSFAPALFNGDWDYHWLFWAAPMLAGVVAPLIYQFIFAKDPPPTKEDVPI